jgi:hypothetical protein
MTRRPSTPGRRYSSGAKAAPPRKYKVTYIKTNGQRFVRTFATEEAKNTFITSARKKHWRIE